jgi:hypothetical protein
MRRPILALALASALALAGASGCVPVKVARPALAGRPGALALALASAAAEAHRWGTVTPYGVDLAGLQRWANEDPEAFDRWADVQDWTVTCDGWSWTAENRAPGNPAYTGPALAIDGPARGPLDRAEGLDR